MKRLLILAVSASMIGGSVMAQQDTTAKEKKGGFMKVLKKGIESTTGLRVSDETLFVYPEIGKWKMSLISCEGDRATGSVAIKINAIQLSGSENYTSARGLITEAEVTGGKKGLLLQRFSVDPLYEFQKGTPTLITFNRVEAPVDVKSLDIKFYINMPTPTTLFEARRIPIVWK